MAERIQVPPTLRGTAEEQTKQIWDYLFRTSETLNRNMQQIGGTNGTEEMQKLNQAMIMLQQQMNIVQQRIRYLNNTVLNIDTEETDMNNITAPGNYWLAIGSMTHKPSAVTNTNVYPLVVMAYEDLVKQFIYANYSIFSRSYDGSSWTGWRQYSSTAL